MKDITGFLKMLSTLFHSWGGDTPQEVYWSANELLDWYEKEIGIILGIRFTRHDEVNSNYNEVISTIKNKWIQ